MTATATNFDLVGAIIDYETGALDFDETVALFQRLLDTGTVWQLQGHYGRTCQALLDAGHLVAPTPQA